jgi:two-component system sensor histidine kinase HupT/HoxJ
MRVRRRRPRRGGKGHLLERTLPNRSTGAAGVVGFDEATWLEVIQRMDEVYSELLQNEGELENKNRELEESHQFLRSVLSAMSDVLLVCDRKGVVKQVNQALLRLTGLAEEVMVGRRIEEFLADTASRRLLDMAAIVARGHCDALQDCEVNFTGPDRTGIPVAVNCSALRDRSQRLQGMVLVGRPVGELRRAYRDLSAAHETLKRTQQQLVQSEKLASLGQLVAGVAHELNNPISFIVGNIFSLRRYLARIGEYLDAVHGGVDAQALRLLREQLRIDHSLRDLGPLIDGTTEGAERTRDIVDALKRFSAVDRDPDQIFDLAEVVERSVHWVSTAAPRRFAVINGTRGPLLVRGSESQMQQVIINLLSNAADAMSETAEPQVDIAASVENATVSVSFRDNGSGIAPEALGRIFDPFFSTKPVGQGTGLGLSISYGIVERHGGRLEACNHPDGGAAFYVHLPLAGDGDRQR